MPTFSKREVAHDDAHWQANWIIFLCLIVPLNILQSYLTKRKTLEKVYEALKNEEAKQVKLEVRRWETILVRNL